MSDPVKEAVERLEARLGARMFDTQPSSDIRRILVELSRLSRLVEEAGEALDKFMPIEVRENRDYAEVFFGDHQTQAMTMEPDDWRALALTHKTIKGNGE